MKQLLLLLTILFVTKLSYSHEANYSVRTPQEKQAVEVEELTQKDVFYRAGEYLEKSAKMQYSAIGFTVGAGGMAAIGAFIKDKHDSKTGEKKTNVGKIACFSASGVLGLCAIYFEIKAIDYKFKAGSTLKVASNGLTFNF